MLGFLGCKCTQLAHVELLVNQPQPLVLLLKAALSPVPAQPPVVVRIALTQLRIAPALGSEGQGCGLLV